MSNTEESNSKRITRSITNTNPELKDQVEEAAIFARSSKLARSPIKSKTGTIPKNITKRVHFEETEEKNTTNPQQGKSVQIRSVAEINLTDSLRDLSLIEIEGITEQPSLIGDRFLGSTEPSLLDTDIVEEETTVQQNTENQQEQDKIIEKPSEELQANKQINQETTKMQDQTNMSRSNIHSWVNVLPTFTGKNIPLSEFIRKIKCIEEYILPADKAMFAVLIRETKLSGDLLRMVAKDNIRSVEDLIKALKKACHSTEDVHKLIAELGAMRQDPDEEVQSYAAKIQQLVEKIKDTQSSETGQSQQKIEDFNLAMDARALQTFLRGLKTEIRATLSHTEELSTAIKEAMDIEADFLKGIQNKWYPGHTNDMGKKYEISKVKAKRCQICGDQETRSTIL